MFSLITLLRRTRSEVWQTLYDGSVATHFFLLCTRRAGSDGRTLGHIRGPRVWEVPGSSSGLGWAVVCGEEGRLLTKPLTVNWGEELCEE